jgi:hypothetical protein
LQAFIGKLISDPCFIIHEPLPHLTSSSSAAPSETTEDVLKCKGSYSEFENFDGDCYLRVEETKTWDEAEAYCASKNSHLASVRSVMENDLVLARSEGTLRYWLGLRYNKVSDVNMLHQI